MHGSSLLVLLSQEFNDIHIVRSCNHYALVIIAQYNYNVFSPFA